MMKLIIFGASGGTGRALVTQALEQGHEVTAFVRSPAALTSDHPRLRVIQGDVLDPASVAATVRGQDAVLNALGMKPGTPQPVTSGGTKNIIAAMQQNGVRRLITVSAIAVAALDGHAQEVPWPFRVFLTIAVPVRKLFEDKVRQEQAIQQSGLEWVIVRPTTLTDGPQTGTYRVGVPLKVGLSAKIARADVADFMLKQLGETRYLQQVPRLSY